MPNGVDWLEKDQTYCKQVARLAGIRAVDRDNLTGCIFFDTGSLWDGRWTEPYWYSVSGDLGRLIWYTGYPTRLFTQSLGLLTETFTEMAVPARSIDFSGFVAPHDKKVYYLSLTVRKSDTVHPDDFDERVWLRHKLLRPADLLLGYKALQEAQRRLKGWGYQ